MTTPTRIELLGRMEALHATSVREERAFTDDEQDAFDCAKATIETLDEEAKNMTTETPTNPLTTVLAAPAVATRAPVTQASLLRSAIALATNDGSLGSIDTGLAREVQAEVERRSPWLKGRGVSIPARTLLGVEKAIGALSGGAAEDLKGTAYLDSLFFRADDALVGPRIAASLGVSTIVGTEERLHVSKLVGRIVPTWIARDADVPDSDAAFDAVEVTPKSIGTNVMIKRSALLYANHPSVEPIVRTEMRDGLLKALDDALLYGPGGLAPVGIVGVAQAGGTLATLADAYRIRGLLVAYQKSDDGMRFLLPDGAEAKLATTIGFTGSTDPAIKDGKLAGYPVVLSAETPAGSAANTRTYFAGNFSFVHLVIWDSVSLLVNPYATGFRSGSIELRILADANVFVRDAKRIFSGNAAV